jgi:hypothetical protein
MAAPPESPDHGATGTMILRRFNGDETYRLESAVFMLLNRYEGEGEGKRLMLEATASSEGAQRNEDTAAEQAMPNAQVNINIAGDDLDPLVGQRFQVPAGYDDDVEDHVATFYYFEHEDLDNNVVEVLAREGAGLRIRWTATTQDVNFYDGSKPAARVEIEAVFVPFQRRR